MSECKGKIISIGEIHTGETQRGKWMSQQWVVEEQGALYPERWALETFGEDKVKEFDLHVGEIVQVQYASRSTEKNGHFYASNRPLTVTKLTAAPIAEQTAQPAAQQA